MKTKALYNKTYGKEQKKCPEENLELSGPPLQKGKDLKSITKLSTLQNWKRRPN
jgi:hypothetical protein